MIGVAIVQATRRIEERWVYFAEVPLSSAKRGIIVKEVKAFAKICAKSRIAECFVLTVSHVVNPKNSDLPREQWDVQFKCTAKDGKLTHFEEVTKRS